MFHRYCPTYHSFSNSISSLFFSSSFFFFRLLFLPLILTKYVLLFYFLLFLLFHFPLSSSFFKLSGFFCLFFFFCHSLHLSLYFFLPDYFFSAFFFFSIHIVHSCKYFIFFYPNSNFAFSLPRSPLLNHHRHHCLLVFSSFFLLLNTRHSNTDPLFDRDCSLCRCCFLIITNTSVKITRGLQKWLKKIPSKIPAFLAAVKRYSKFH